MEDNHKEHDIFLLMLNLAQQKNPARIKNLFIDAMNSFWGGVSFQFLSDDEAFTADAIHVATMRGSYGKIVIEGDRGILSAKDGALIRNAVAMLAIILENRHQALILEKDNLWLDSVIKERTTKLQELNEELAAALKEKTILLKEVHHRVKNNLQIITTLLDLQSETIGDTKSLEAFRDSQHRIRAMARAHEQLYRNRSLSSIDMESYIFNIVGSLRQTYKKVEVEIEFDIENISLDIDRAVYSGLIVNELVSNSLKYAFPTEAEGKIYVELKMVDGNYRMCVGDNGVGLPDDLVLENTESLGLRLVEMLQEQLSATMDVNRKNDTKFTLIFDR